MTRRAVAPSEYDLVTACRTPDCPWPADEELHRTPWCVAIEGHECWGGVTHQHKPRKGMGGKNPDSRIVGLICQGIHMALDSGAGLDNRRYSDRVAPETATSPPHYIIVAEVKGHPRTVLVHPIPPDQRIGLPPITYNSKTGGAPMTNEPAIIDQPAESWLTPTGLRPLPDNLPYEEWERIGEALGGIHTACQWAIGDWIRFGEAHYGEKYAQALEVTKRSEGGLKNIVSVCEAFPDEKSRRGDLSFGHHAVTAALARTAPEDAQAVLQRAGQGGWSVEQVRAELRPAVSAPPTVKRYTIDEFEMALRQWAEQADRPAGLATGLEFLEWLRAQ